MVSTNSRQKAKARSRGEGALANLQILTPEEIRRRLHELKANRIELETQNKELRRTQEELEASRARYFELYDLAPVGNCTLDEKGLILEANLSAATLLGVAREKLVKQPFTRFILKKDQDIYYLHRKQLLENGAPQACDLRMVKKGGTSFWARMEATSAREAEGALSCRIVLSDITEHKRVEEELRESEERYRSLVEHAPAFITINDREGRMLFINRVLPEYDLKQVYQSTTYDHILPEYHEQVRNAFEKVFSQGAPQSYQLQGLGPDGKIAWYQTNLGPIWDEEAVVAATQVAIDITPLKKAEAALREREERLRLMLEGTDEGIWDWDVAGGEIQLDDNWIRVLGYVPGERAFDFSWWESCLHADSRPVFEQALAAYLEGRTKYYEIEYRMRAKSGEWRWIWARGVCVAYDREGRPLRLIGTHRDITERKRTEEALWQTEANYQTLVEQSVQGLIVLEGGRIVFANSALADICGYPVEELQSLSPEQVTALIHPEDQALVWGHFRDRLAGKAAPPRYQYRGVRKDGSVRWLEMAASLITYGGQPAIQGSIIDINERKCAEEALSHSHRLMRYIIEHNRSAIAVHDRELKYVYVSRRYLDDYKVKEKDVIGRHHYEVFPDLPQKWREVHRKALAGEISSAEDDPYERDDGSVDWTRWECRPWHEADGSIGGIIIYTEVITERKRVEEALRSSLEEKESLLKEVHHRVKNNLQVISSLLSLQFRQVKNAEVRSFLRDTQNRIRSMATLHEILYRSGTVARINFPDYVQGLCGHLARSYDSAARNIRLRLEIAPVALNLDQAVTAGLIINELVTNAFKHAFPSHSGGEILVTLRAVDEGHLLLRVTDDGVGFLPEKSPKSTETLGLLLVENLSRQLEGRLSIGSGPATVFEIIFSRSPIERESE